MEALTRQLENITLRDYSIHSAKQKLSSALDEIERHERKLLTSLNEQLQSNEPFLVKSCKDGFSITFGKKLIELIIKDFGVGSRIEVENKSLLVVKIREKSIVARSTSKKPKKLPNGCYGVKFQLPNRPHQTILQLLNIKLMFPTATPHHADKEIIHNQDQDISLNPIQNAAVSKALEKPIGDNPVPYLVRGPPGTGKTTTLVKLIQQILIRESDPMIIVCTPSNRAADNVVERLPKMSSDVLRLISVAEELKMDAIKKVSGINYSSTYSPNFRVVICTIGMLAHLYCKKGEPEVAPTHLIIDEASMVIDTEMVLVLGLIHQETRFIMFGDEKQLGPVIKVDSLKDSYLQKSMFERLLNNKKFEGASVCLLENYRSCPGVVAPFNNLFYESKLIAKVSNDKNPQIFQQLSQIHKTLMGSSSLEDPTGVYFRNMTGKCEQGDSKSWKNTAEAKGVVKIFKSLVKSGVSANEIGIITPYLEQVKEIKAAIKDETVTIGSVDSFQGQERNVILVSTVRSFGSNGIGFVGDKKRLNVTLSRAKTALIIVGNRSVLKRNKLFKNFFDLGGIHFIKSKKGNIS